jgi:hypothetical protein
MSSSLKRSLPFVLSLSCAASTARASVIYDFSGTGVPFGPIDVAFHLTVPDFIDPALDGPFVFVPCSDLDSSTNCLSEPWAGVSFTNQSAGGAYSAILNFDASNDAGYSFFFPTGAFITPGTYTGFLPGPDFNPGVLTVTESDDTSGSVPEPATVSLLGLAAVVIRRRVRSRVSAV